MKTITTLLTIGLMLFSCTPRAIPVIPTVTSGEITNITTTTATCTGNLTADGGAAVLARGVCWSSSQFPTISDLTISSGNGLGVFTVNISGLSPNTTYYVRAYATNSAGTAYGDQKTFKTQEVQKIPSVITEDITNITTTTATCSGNVTADGGASVTARGICWSTSQNPTTADSKTTDGTGTGSFTSYLTGLTPNTTYYVRSYATNSVGTAYGVQKSFKTQDDRTIPSVTTGDVTNITITTATCTGNVTADGKADVTARGICWSTSENPTTSNNKTINGLGLGSYTTTISGLSPNTTYHVRAYATNSIGTAYGEQKTFKTEDNSFIDRRDGKVYKYVTIGNQVWMAENLAYLPSVVAPKTIDFGKGYKYYYVYGYYGTSVTEAKAHTNYTTYGVLYNLPAALSACPSGWHLPTDAEWTTLTTYLGGEEVAGGKMKETGTAHWDSPNEGATNESGFTALASGDCYIEFFSIGRKGSWWSSTLSEDEGTWNWIRYIYNDSSNVKRNKDSSIAGLSVRCVKD